MAPPTKNDHVLSPPQSAKRPGEDPTGSSSPIQPSKRVKVETSSNMTTAPTKPAAPTDENETNPHDAPEVEVDKEIPPVSATPSFMELVDEFGGHLKTFGALETRIKNRDFSAVPEFETNFLKGEQLLNRVMGGVSQMGQIQLEIVGFVEGQEVCRNGMFDHPKQINLFGPRMPGGGNPTGSFGNLTAAERTSVFDMTFGEFMEAHGSEFLRNVVPNIKFKHEEDLRAELMKVYEAECPLSSTDDLAICRLPQRVLLRDEVRCFRTGSAAAPRTLELCLTEHQPVTTATVYLVGGAREERGASSSVEHFPPSFFAFARRVGKKIYYERKHQAPLFGRLFGPALTSSSSSDDQVDSEEGPYLEFSSEEVAESALKKLKALAAVCKGPKRGRGDSLFLVEGDTDTEERIYNDYVFPPVGRRKYNKELLSVLTDGKSDAVIAEVQDKVTKEPQFVQDILGDKIDEKIDPALLFRVKPMLKAGVAEGKNEEEEKTDEADHEQKNLADGDAAIPFHRILQHHAKPAKKTISGHGEEKISMDVLELRVELIPRDMADVMRGLFAVQPKFKMGENGDVIVQPNATGAVFGEVVKFSDPLHGRCGIFKGGQHDQVTTNSAGGGIFGGGQHQVISTGIFLGGGQHQVTSGGGIFGGGGGGSFFGGSAEGSPVSKNIMSSSGSGLFGGPSASQGGGLLSQHPGGIFGGASQPQNTGGGGSTSIVHRRAGALSIGGSTSIFGHAAPSTGGGLFGCGSAPARVSAETTGGSLFGAASQQQTTGGSLFGAASQQQTTGGELFGGESQPVTSAASIFGTAPPTSGTTSSDTDIFGGGVQK